MKLIRTLLLFATLALHVHAADAKKPNVLFLLADDQCFETIRALGHTDIDTPNLDRLVQRGATFTHAYNMGSWSGAVCVASRTMLITGRSVWRANAIYDKTEKEREAGRLWPQMMSGAGYATYFTGKWHIKADATKAFDVAKDIRAGMPKEYVDRYPLDRIAVPKNFLPEYPHKDAIGCGPSLRDEKLGPFPRTEHAVKVHRQEYYAIITHMDAQIGRILDALEKSGQAENTWIFFTADHGLALGHHGLFGKQNMYDHSLRVPFLVSGPGVKAGAKLDAPIYLQDAMATALDLAGVPKPEQVEFHSVLPLLRGEKSPAAREAIYGAYLALQRAVIHDGWKLIAYPKAKTIRLYHLADDPGETRDLAAEPAPAERRRALFQRLLAMQKELDDKLDLAVAFPNPQFP